MSPFSKHPSFLNNSKSLAISLSNKSLSSPSNNKFPPISYNSKFQMSNISKQSHNNRQFNNSKQPNNIKRFHIIYHNIPLCHTSNIPSNHCPKISSNPFIHSKRHIQFHSFHHKQKSQFPRHSMLSGKQ